MITSGELDALRAEAERLLTDSCIVRSPGTPVSDSAGGWTDGTATDSDAIAFSQRMPRPGMEMNRVAQLQIEKPWVFMLPSGTTVAADDKIVVDTDVYNVVGLLEGGTREVLLRVLVMEEQA